MIRYYAAAWVLWRTSVTIYLLNDLEWIQVQGDKVEHQQIRDT